MKSANYGLQVRSDQLLVFVNVVVQFLPKVKVAQLFLTLCDPMDCSLPGPFVHWVLQERIREWVAIPFSRGYSWPRDWTWVSCIAGRFFTVWVTRAYWLLFYYNCRLISTETSWPARSKIWSIWSFTWKVYWLLFEISAKDTWPQI